MPFRGVYCSEKHAVQALRSDVLFLCTLGPVRSLLICRERFLLGQADVGSYP